MVGRESAMRLNRGREFFNPIKGLLRHLLHDPQSLAESCPNSAADLAPKHPSNRCPASALTRQLPASYPALPVTARC